MDNTHAGHNFTPEPLRRAQTFYSPIWDEPNLLSLGTSSHKTKNTNHN